jgi:predicted O-methyltransferase YrrM
MTLDTVGRAPPAWRAIEARTRALGFGMGSDERTGALLATLAATKPGGRLLELGSGTGLATAWLLAGMDEDARLTSVDVDERVQTVAREALGGDPRVTFVLADGLEVLRKAAPGSFDLIFADAIPGKYDGLDLALGRLALGGLYVGDDMRPQPNWPDGHQSRVDGLLDILHADARLQTVTLAWGSGFVVAARRA